MRARHAGATVLLMKKSKFMKHCYDYHKMGKAVSKSVLNKDLEMVKQLVRVVFNRWYSDYE